MQLDLNFGKASDAQWISSNEEIVKIERNTGKLTPVGAGRTQVTATYTIGWGFQCHVYGAVKRVH